MSIIAFNKEINKDYQIIAEIERLQYIHDELKSLANAYETIGNKTMHLTLSDLARKVEVSRMFLTKLI